MTTIPFGGTFVPLTLTSMAGYLAEEDKIPLLLACSLYKSPLPSLGPYLIIESSVTPRLAAWFDSLTGICIIGLKGTTISSRTDLADDKVRHQYSHILLIHRTTLPNPRSSLSTRPSHSFSIIHNRPILRSSRRNLSSRTSTTSRQVRREG